MEGRQYVTRLVMKGITLVLAIGAGLVAPAAVADAAPAARPTLVHTDKPLSLHEYVAHRDAHRAAAAAQGMTTFAADCRHHVYFWSVIAEKYVTVEVRQTGERQNMLRARGPEFSAWEDLTLCYDMEFDYIYSWAADMYVSTDLNNTVLPNVLRASTHVVRDWEKFFVQCSEVCTIWSLAAGKYVMADMSYAGSDKGILRARANTVGTWELFL